MDAAEAVFMVCRRIIIRQIRTLHFPGFNVGPTGKAHIVVKKEAAVCGSIPHKKGCKGAGAIMADKPAHIKG